MLVNGSSPKSAEVKKTEQKPSTKLKENTRKVNETDKDKDNGKEKKRRSKPRVRRLSSLESLESIEAVTTPPADTETEEFLSKLNSPTKKRDSLLGYFPKKESPKEVAAKQALEIVKAKSTPPAKSATPRRRGRKPAITQINDDSTPSTEKVSVQQLENVDEVGTPSGRPRRSCAGKTRYDFDVDDSPTKTSTNPRGGTPARKVATRNYETPTAKSSTLAADNAEIIVLDDSTNMSNASGNVTPQGTPKKLAPLFVRSVPKPSPDPEIVKARRAFLQSGVPEKLRIEQEKQKQIDQNYEESTEIFPKIAHIRQLSEEDKIVDEQIVCCSLKLQNEEDYLRICSPTPRRGRCKSNKRTSHIGDLAECTPSDFQVGILNVALKYSIHRYL